MRIDFIAADGHIKSVSGSLETIAKAFRKHIGHTDCLVSGDGLVRAELYGCTLADIERVYPRNVMTYYYPDIPGGKERVEKELQDHAAREVSREESRTLSGYPIVEIWYIPKKSEES